MSERYDAVVVGAGHNGLAAAAYLARAGRSVLVLERSDAVGGTIQTREFTPGFHASPGFQSAETLARSVIKELKLASHGLVLSPARGTALAIHDGGWLRFDGKGRLVNGDQTASGGGVGLSSADARSLRDLERLISRIAGVLAPLYQAPLPEVEDLRAGDKLDLLRVGWRLRRLGRRDMQEAMRLLPMSMRDVVEERFDSAPLRALVAGLGLQGGWRGPYAAGTFFRAVHDQIPNPRRPLSGPAYVRGGMAALAKALADCARAAGAEIRTEAEVGRIETERGSARGVTLTTGEHVEAGTVVSGADPLRTYLSLLDAAVLTPEFLHAVRGIRASAGVAPVTFALDGLPESVDGANVAELLAGRVQIGAAVIDLERAFDAAAMGVLPERPAVQLFVPSLWDTGLAPAGQHVVTAWTQAVPRRLVDDSEDDDGWLEGRDRLADIVAAVIEEVLPGFTERVVARAVAAPPDLEQLFAATGGCLYDADLGLDQALYLRPLPGWSGYRTPVAGLYLCGAGTHGGGGVTGLAGRNAASRVLEDLEAASKRGAA